MEKDSSERYVSIVRLKKNAPTIIIHLLMWLALFSLPLLFRPHFGQGHNSIDMPFRVPVPIWMNNLFLIIAFYSNLLWLMPNFFNRRKWGYYFLFTSIFLISSFFVHSIAMEVDHLFGHHILPSIGRHERSPRGFEFRQFSFIFMFIMVWTLSMVYYLFEKLQESLQHADKVHALALQSELSFLKAQINPHFLFNTLNNIYVLTLKKSEAAPLAVMKLSNLMRKITNDTGVDFVPFDEEESFIRDYIELQELRLTDKTCVNYVIEGSYGSLEIAPRILIPFIDNAFKYGVSNRRKSDITIRFEFVGKSLLFTIKNAIHPKTGESLESSGVGLENSKRRLDLLYKNCYNLTITETPDSYQVFLTIDLT